MTDDERFFADVDRAEPASAPVLGPGGWDALPLPVRVAERLADALIAAGDVRALLDRDDAAPMAWIGPEVERLFQRIDGALRRLTF